VKIATVFEVYTTEEQRSSLRFYGQKDSMQRIFIKKCFLLAVESVCCVKRCCLGDKRYPDYGMVETEVVETTVKRFLSR
jgi:hypothetical protein